MKALEKPAAGDRETGQISARGRGRNVKGVGLMTLSHYIGDIYPGFIPPLLPLFIDKFGLSLVLAGAVGTLLSLSTSVCQLGFGWLADRLSRRIFVILGPLTACVFLSFAPLSSSYAQLLVMVVIGGLGVAAFHPSAAALAGAYAGERKGLAVSIFAAAGAVGFATGPLLILCVVATFGLEKSYIAAAPGLLAVAILALTVPKSPASSPARVNAVGRIWRHWKLLLLLWFVALIRAGVIMGFENFVPIIITEKGGSLMSGGRAISLFLLCGSLGGLTGGYLSDKLDPRKVLLFSSIAPVPLLIAFLNLASPFNLICLGFAGAFAFAGVPITIVMAQESVPGRTGVASSVVMGMAWGVGGTAPAAVGLLADSIGATSALSILAVASLVSAPVIPFLPGRRAEPQAITLP